MGEKVVNKDKFFQGMTKEERRVFDELLPFEDNTPIEEIKERKKKLPKDQQEKIDQICKNQYDRRVREVVEADREIANRQLRAQIKKLAASFLKTPVAKFLYVVILAILAAKLLGW